MKCYLEFVSTPTVDTPGTLLFLHYDSRRYLIGNMSEGTSRACLERGVGIRKVSTILLTGRTEWANVGGLLGLMLNLADVKQEAKGSKLDIYGPPNLNHMVASSRRFIFRTGMPMNIFEHRESRRMNNEPTWQDECIRVWTMSILPSTSRKSTPSSPRKRSFDELDDDYGHGSNAFGDDPFLEMRQAVVGQMFNSTWRLDNLMPQKLSHVRFPAKVFVRDSETKQYMEYKGPLPGGTEPVSDITVWAREPWPGALTEYLVSTKPAHEAISYIIRNYPQRGKFLPEKALELQVPKGYLWSQLTRGITVQNAVGEDVTPEMVLEPSKEGGGVAVVDLPSTDYLEALISRPEWRNKEIMVGVEAIVWILGKGIASDERLQKFQAEMSHMRHIISSADCCPNVLSLEAAAANSLRHNHIDNKIFPELQYSPVHTQSSDPSILQVPTESVAAQRGQILTLEPKVEIQNDETKPPLDLPSLQAKILDEFKTLDKAVKKSNTSGIDDELKQWQATFPHGDAEIIILGTGSSHPSRCRNVSGTLLRVPGCGSYLLDCGEGTLGTLRRMFDPLELRSILQDLKMIWISHMHADHHLGLASVIKAWSEATREIVSSQRLAVISDAPMLQWLHEYGTAEDLGLDRVIPLATTPTRDRKTLEQEQGTKLCIIKSLCAQEDAAVLYPGMETEAQCLSPLNIKSLNSVWVSHCRGAQAVSITFKTGLKISYSGDCRPSANFAVIGKNSDVLIHEATFEDDMRAEAFAKKHSTAGEAFIVASEMKAKVCLLTHFSQRYPEMPRLGTSINASKAPTAVPEISYLPEDPLASEPPADIDDELEMKNNDGNSEPVHPLRPTQNPSLSDIITRTFDPSRLLHDRSGKIQLISSSTISRLLASNDIKVLFAFDYMRLKLSSVPILERKQPLLRQMYDQGIGKDMLKEVNEDDEVKDTEGVKEQRKKVKGEKVGEERAKAEKKRKEGREGKEGKEKGKVGEDKRVKASKEGVERARRDSNSMQE